MTRDNHIKTKIKTKIYTKRYKDALTSIIEYCADNNLFGEQSPYSSDNKWTIAYNNLLLRFEPLGNLQNYHLLTPIPFLKSVFAVEELIENRNDELKILFGIYDK